MPYFSNSKVNFPVKDFKITLKEEFKRKKGLAIHYYFEHILNNLEEDRKTARSALLSRYGNMLGKTILIEIISRLEEFISKIGIFTIKIIKYIQNLKYMIQKEIRKSWTE